MSLLSYVEYHQRVVWGMIKEEAFVTASQLWNRKELHQSSLHLNCALNCADFSLAPNRDLEMRDVRDKRAHKAMTT